MRLSRKRMPTKLCVIVEARSDQPGVPEPVRVFISESLLSESPGCARRVPPVDPSNGGLSNVSLAYAFQVGRFRACQNVSAADVSRLDATRWSQRPKLVQGSVESVWALEG